MPLRPTTKVNEGTSCRLQFTLVDYDETGIEAANISTATMTLKDKKTEKVINSRTDTDVSANFGAGGAFSRVLTAADNAIISATRKPKVETHIATFTIVTTGGLDLVEEVYIQVQNLKYTG